MRQRWKILIILILVGDALGLGLWLKWRREHRHDEPIRTAAARYAVDPALVKAVVWRESRFDARARGKAGEIGLMQIREPAAREWAAAEKLAGFHHEQIVDPGTNALAGAWYLAKLLKRYRQTDNPLPYALADYNAGRTKVLAWLDGAAKTNHLAFLERMDYPGTKAYIIAITNQWPRYRRDFPVTTR